MYSFISKMILKWWGWTVGPYPYDLPKCIVAVAPHTSNWDFPLGILVRSAGKINAKFVAKHTIFIPPVGWLLKRWGGVPVDRRQRGNFVQAVVDEFNRRDYFHIVIAPEGTRSKVDRFKTGFYHIAKSANVPIVLCTFDWATRTVLFKDIFYPTDDEAKDMAFLWNYFKDIQGCNPEQGVI